MHFHAVVMSHLFHVNSLHDILCMSVTFCPNHEQVALELIKTGANLEAQQNGGFTALMLSAQNGHDLCARALIEKGANGELAA